MASLVKPLFFLHVSVHHGIAVAEERLGRRSVRRHAAYIYIYIYIYNNNHNNSSNVIIMIVTLIITIIIRMRSPTTGASVRRLPLAAVGVMPRMVPTHPYTYIYIYTYICIYTCIYMYK